MRSGDAARSSFRRHQGGYAMVALLVGLGVMGVMASMALPVWSQVAKREREAELVFRGEQYARAIELYQRQFAGAYPADLETLVEQRFLRRIYKDPMVEDGAFQVVYQGQLTSLTGTDDDDAAADDADGGDDTAADDGDEPDEPETTGVVELREPTRRPGGRLTGIEGGIVGVVSRSTEPSLRLYNGASRYSEWLFVHTTSTDRPGTSPDGRPGVTTPFPQRPDGAGRGPGVFGVGAGTGRGQF